MSRSNKSKGLGFTTALLDLNTLLALAFAAMTFLLLIFIQPIIPQKQDIPLDEQLLIKMEWDDNIDNDVDLWVMDPSEQAIGFRNKNGAGITLERDDLGYRQEFAYLNGEMSIIKDNTEVVRVKRVSDGTYYVNVHHYSSRGWLNLKRNGKEVPDQERVVITVYWADRHTPIAIHNLMVKAGQEVPVMALTFESGELVNVENHTRVFVLNYLMGSGG